MIALLLAAALETQWPTFAHDDRRTGLQTTSSITPANVASLKLHWSRALGETPRALFTSSPIVVNGVIYVASRGGWLYALSAADGSTKWKTHLGPDIRMTPAFVNGRLLVGIYGIEPIGGLPHSASLQSVDPATGKVLWKAEMPGVERSDPIVVNGVVYVGTAGGDAEVGATNGRVLTFDEKTGKPQKMTWFTTKVGHAGGGIWSPFSFDKGLIFFGTGVTTDSSGYEDMAVAVDPQLEHTVFAKRQHILENHDEDVGAGVSIFGDTFYSAGKTGYLFAYDRATGNLKWRSDLHADAIGGGGVGTPTGDGTMIVGDSGDGSSEPPHKTKLIGFDLKGKQLWELSNERESTTSLTGSFVKGMGFAAIDNSLIAFASHTGAIAWKYDTADYFYAIPAIVGDHIYDVDRSGNVYAFGLNATTVRSELIAPPPAPTKSRRRKLFIAAGGAIVLIVIAAAIFFRLRIAKRAQLREKARAT